MIDYPYPLTIVLDRYGGTYSGASFLAFNCDPAWIPEEIDDDDTTCSNYWYNNPNELVGKGETPDAAVDDLITKIKALPVKEG